MESLALTLFVLCTCTGLVSVAIMARWLRGHLRSQPDVVLADPVRADPIVTPLSASAAAAGAVATSTLATPRRPPPVLDDEPTQPWARTQTWGPMDASDWPTTVLDPSQAPDAESKRPAEPGFADTQPMPPEAVPA